MEGSPDCTARQHNGCRPVQLPGFVLLPQDLESSASDRAKEVLFYRQYYSSSLNPICGAESVLGEEKNIYVLKARH